ncbi:hypothetical protein F5B20DRAFT_140237 [Whalleya microplaca]|nr:hypothetical protein F5B20DRAFT_140237 [Whalleya microplaca]
MRLMLFAADVGLHPYINEDDIPSWIPQLMKLSQHEGHIIWTPQRRCSLAFDPPYPTVMHTGILKLHGVVYDEVAEVVRVGDPIQSEPSVVFWFNLCIEITTRIGSCRYKDDRMIASLAAMLSIMHAQPTEERFSIKYPTIPLPRNWVLIQGFLFLLKAYVKDISEAEMNDALMRVGLSSREHMYQFLENQVLDFVSEEDASNSGEIVGPETRVHVEDFILRCRGQAFFKTTKG